MSLPDGYSIRRFVKSDAARLAEITLAAIRSVGSARYSSEQIGVWASRHPGPDRFIHRARAGHVIFVAQPRQSEAAAYALLEPDGHLDMLYCHPDHTRRGLADGLLAHAETHARDQGATRLYTEASELARPAFERAGYEVLHRRDLAIDGVAIHNFAMEKRLS